MLIKVGEDKYLVSQEIANETPVVAGPVNALLILDRSGSVGWALPRMVKQVYALVTTRLKPGDTVTVGWFSGPGTFGWAVKAYSLNGDNRALEKMLNSLAHSLNTTCFSEILADTDSVIAELSAISNAFELFLFTDGCPVVPDEKKETHDIFTAIAKLKGKINTSVTVGYGDYYNRALMADMASALGGSLIHEANLEKLDSMVKFFDNAKGDPRRAVEVGDQVGTVFTLHRGQVIAQRPEQGEVRITQPDDNRIWMMVSQAQGTPAPITDAPEAAYAAAYVLSQQGQYLEAVQVLSQIGDVGLTTRLYNARTNEEYGLVENAILQAVYDRQARCKDGYKVGCAPDSNAFSVMDVINLLMADPVAALWPVHPKLNYKSIGPKPEPDGDYPKFKAHNVSTPFNALAWNKSRLNLSVRCRIPGDVELRGDELYGLNRTFVGYKWANRSILSDGYLNIKRLPVTVGDVTRAALIKAGVPMEVEGNTLILHLDELPIVNTAFVAGNTSLRKLFADRLDTLALEYQLKALNWKRNELDPEKETKQPVSPYTPEETEILFKNGLLADGQYAPPMKKAEPTDFYTATEMEVSVKGFSSAPACDKVARKVKEGAKLTPAETLLADALKQLAPMPSDSKLAALAWLDAEIAARKSNLEAIRGRMAAAKLGIVLGKQAWKEFPTRQDVYELAVQGVDCKLEVKPVQVKF